MPSAGGTPADEAIYWALKKNTVDERETCLKVLMLISTAGGHECRLERRADPTQNLRRWRIAWQNAPQDVKHRLRRWKQGHPLRLPWLTEEGI